MTYYTGREDRHVKSALNRATKELAVALERCGLGSGLAFSVAAKHTVAALDETCDAVLSLKSSSA
ncbi:MAG: hypothetical protein J0G33_08150 [Afipia felis]|nr:hypothetical protein [Afipia felis]